MSSAKREQIIGKLGDKEYRDAFVEHHIRVGLPFQLRATRDERGWSQEELGQRAGMAQETISLLENPRYGKFTLRTLRRLVSALDVALVVRIAPFSELVDWEVGLSPEDLAVPSFNNDPGLRDPSAESSSVPTAELVREILPSPPTGKIMQMSDHVLRRSSGYERTGTAEEYTDEAEPLVRVERHG